MKYAEVLRVAQRNGYSLTQAEILRFVSRKTLVNWVSRKLVDRLAADVYVFNADLDWEQRLRAYAKSSPDLIVGRRSAARIWAISPLATSQFEFVVNRDTNRSLPGARVYESNCLDVKHWGIRNGLNVTSPARTIFDLSDQWGPDLLRRTFECALDKRLVTLGETRRIVETLRCRGRSRVRFLDAILDDPRYDDPKNRSWLEREARMLIKRAGLPEPVSQHSIVLEHVTLHPDLCYPEIGLAIELDGRDAHGNSIAFDDDRERDARLSIEGWSVHRFSNKTLPLLVPVLRRHICSPYEKG